MMSDETKKQVILMSVGIVLHNLVLFLICLIWFRSAPVFLGILTGMAAAELWLLSMAYSTELCAASADENYARKKMVTHALLRSLAVFGGIALVWKFTDINLLSLVVGILGLKTGGLSLPGSAQDRRPEDRIRRPDEKDAYHKKKGGAKEWVVAVKRIL